MRCTAKIKGRMAQRVVVALLGCSAAITLGGCGSETLSADAGEDFSIGTGESPEFDGCNSTGDIAEFAWQILEAPADMADDTGKVLTATESCSFTLESDMEVADVGVWVIELTATDKDGESATDLVTVTVSE